MSLCKYRYALGIPNRGVHSYKIMGISIMDVLMTFIGAGLFSYFFKISFVYTSIFLFILGIILHRLFCVRTTVDILLFGN